VRRADNLTTFKRRLSINLGASTSWNPVGLSRPVMGLLYLLQSELLAETVFSALHHLLSPSLSSTPFNFSPFPTHYGHQLQQSYGAIGHVDHAHIEIIIFSVTCI
jgi:hypothetical protein